MSAPQLLGPAAAMRLAETFAHFLWQGSAIVLVVALAWPALRRASASARYRVLVFALLLTAAAPVVTFWTLNANEATGARRATSKGSAPSTLPELTPVIPRAFPLDQVRPRGGAIQPPSVAEYPSAFERYAPALLAAYAVGVLGMLIRLVWSLGAGQRLRRQSEPVDDPVLLAAMRRRIADLNLRFTPALLWCRGIAVPGVVGVVRPAILLPIAIACELSPQQVEAILAHELAHLRRFDHLVLILQHLIEAFLFFHPAVWILSRRIDIERENCCDDLAVGRMGEPSRYAEALLRIAELACGTGIRITALSAAGEPSLLRRRIDRLLRPRRRERLYVTRPAALSLSIVCVMAMGLVLHARVEAPPPEGRQHAAAGPATAPTSRASDALQPLQRELQKLEVLDSLISQAAEELSQARPGRQTARTRLNLLKEIRADQAEKVRNVESRSPRAANARDFGDDVQAVIQARVRKLLELEKSRKEAHDMLVEAQAELDLANAGMKSGKGNTPEEIARVNPAMAAKVNKLNALQIHAQGMQSRFGSHHPQAREELALIALYQKDIEKSADEFNSKYIVKQMPDGTGVAVSKDLSALKSVAERLDQEYETEKDAIRQLVERAQRDHGAGEVH